LFYFNNFIILFILSFSLGLWHPHQSFFIGISFFISQYIYFEEIRWRQVVTVLASLAFAAVVFFLWKASLDFDYSGRGAFMEARMPELLYRNLLYAPAAFLPIALWFWFIPIDPHRDNWLLGGWLLILAVVSLLTTDVTRVMTLTALPLLLAESKKLIEKRRSMPARRLVLFASLIALIPPFSWSGFDYLVWTDFVSDLCDWGIYCL
jgi:cell division protein FtsW (lipid II flippase)